uniref:alginate lyase family protein n=1 Tax=Flavobacterium sp. TaxID=239 RepID=UPI00404A9536
MGFRYICYRVTHVIESKFGLLKKRHPIKQAVKKFIALEDWKNSTTTFVIDTRENTQLVKNPNPELKEKATKILNGEIFFFSSEWKNLGKDYDWVTNPETNFQYDISKHWSEINDFNPLNGDIKYVWEKSRFNYLLTIMRYDYHFNEDHAAFVFSEIESWIDANPVNQGPNWKCSQEISLRLFNWMYVLQFYKNSSVLTETLWDKIQNVIYWSLHHTYNHINFSRIAVRNNHAITETLALTISDLLFPFIPETNKWAKKGKKWLEQEIDYQVYDDGTFLQFSMNYHRVLIQLFSFGISLTDKYNKQFSKLVYDKAYKSLNFLYQCLQKENGFLPNYGANDGALFFPLSENQYRDYRPQLNALHVILTGEKLFEEKEVQEEVQWVKNVNEPKHNFEKLTQKAGVISFKNGGYYICRTETAFTFIRCGSHKDRPSHADNLHVDVWVKGKNILRDSGTYKYNTDKEFGNYFTGTKGHNTVVVNNDSQMLKGSRFIWFYWSQSKVAEWSEEKEYYIFSGKISAFRYLNKRGMHSRDVKVSKNENLWWVRDEVENLDIFSKKQIWHFDNATINFSTCDNKYLKEDSFNSSFYGQIEAGSAIAIPFHNKVETKIEYSTK